jgi:hypothetical protein
MNKPVTNSWIRLQCREEALPTFQQLPNDWQLSEGVLALRIVERRLGHGDYVVRCRGLASGGRYTHFRLIRNSGTATLSSLEA